jgi:hypothetical protein
VISRLVKYQGIQGALLALPVIALGGYAIVAAGVGFSVVRWIKTAERDRLFHHEHRAPASLAADDARGEVPQRAFARPARRQLIGAATAAIVMAAAAPAYVFLM